MFRTAPPRRAISNSALRPRPLSITAVMDSAAATNLPAITTRLILYRGQSYADLEITLHDKPLDSWPEAGWLCLPFKVDAPRFRLGRLGSIIDPAKDIVPNSNRDLFVLNTGLTLTDPQGRRSRPVPARSSGREPRQTGMLAIFQGGVPAQAGRLPQPVQQPMEHQFQALERWHLDLARPHLGGGPRRGRGSPDHAVARSPLSAPGRSRRHNHHPAASAPAHSRGLSVSRRGVLVTAFGDILQRRDAVAAVGTGRRLRDAHCETCPRVSLPTRAIPVNLRGEPAGEPIPIRSTAFRCDLKPFSPASFVLANEVEDEGRNEPMRAIQSICLMFMMMLASYAAPAAESGSTTLMGQGWTIETQGDRGRLTIKHERLGTILRDVRLNLEANGAVQEMTQWKAEVTGPVVHTSSSREVETKQWTPESGIPGRLLVRTAQPPSTWIFEPTRECLKISSTAPGAVLTGLAPVSKARGLARLLDAEGIPVIWQGTGECAGTYGGGYTRNTSFLPRENPECMYFALGQVSGSVFHNLFDQKTDTAIRFTPQTRFSAGAPTRSNWTLGWRFRDRVRSGLFPTTIRKFSDFRGMSRWTPPSSTVRPWCGAVGPATLPTRRKRIYDMYGNVCERVSDTYARDYYANSPKEDPTGPSQGEKFELRLHGQRPTSGNVRVDSAGGREQLQSNTQRLGERRRSRGQHGAALHLRAVEAQRAGHGHAQGGREHPAFLAHRPPQAGIAVKSFTLKPAK